MSTASNKFYVSCVEDGIDAAQSTTYPNVFVVKANYNGVCTASQGAVIYPGMKVGNTAISITSDDYSVVSAPSGVTYQKITTSSTPRLAIAVAANVEAANYEGAVVLQIIKTYNDISYTAYATINIVGQRQGMATRTPFFFGNYSEMATSGTAFTVTDYQTPYVLIDEDTTYATAGSKYIFVGANGTYNKSTAGEPGYSANWEIMEQSHQYLITKAIFTDFARLGSWIVNGDYMFSNQGTSLTDGSTTSIDNGAVFAGEGDASNTYTPNTYMDAANGKIYSQLGYFKGVILEGVLNNLIQRVTADNASDYFYINTDIGNLNPLKCGNCMILDFDTEYSSEWPFSSIKLPTAYLNNSATVISGQKEEDGTVSNFTLEELRQCIGKKIYMIVPINPDATPTWEISFVALPYVYIRKEKYINGSSVSTSIGAVIDTSATYTKQITLTPSSEYYADGIETAACYQLEMKLGTKDGYEMMYWEITPIYNALVESEESEE